MSYDSWKTNAPKGHKEGCICEVCHQEHRWHLEEFAKLPDYECCREEIDYLIEQGLWCRKHGGAFIDPGWSNHCYKCRDHFGCHENTWPEHEYRKAA